MSEYRVIVCGGRDYTDQDAIRSVLSRWKERRADVVIVHGDARGTDRLADHVARMMGFVVERYPADWSGFGRAAGPIRNQIMVDSGADLVVAFPGGAGTRDLVRRAVKRGIPVERA